METVNTKTTDWVAGTAIALMLVTRFVAVIYFSMIAQQTQTSIEAVHTSYEVNPIYKYIMNIEKVGFMLENFIFPAMLFTIYYVFRRRVKQGKLSPEPLFYHALLVFFLVLQNFLNDVAALAGVLLR